MTAPTGVLERISSLLKDKRVLGGLVGVRISLVLLSFDWLTFKTLNTTTRRSGGSVNLLPFHRAQITPDYSRWHGMDLGTVMGSYDVRRIGDSDVLTVHYPITLGQTRDYHYEIKPGKGGFFFISIDSYTEPLAFAYVEEGATPPDGFLY